MAGTDKWNAWLLCGAPLDNDNREFVMVTLWKDIEAIEAFLGKDWQTPVVTADEVPLVAEMFAHHYVRFDREAIGAE